MTFLRFFSSVLDGDIRLNFSFLRELVRSGEPTIYFLFGLISAKIFYDSVVRKFYDSSEFLRTLPDKPRLLFTWALFTSATMLFYGRIIWSDELNFPYFWFLGVYTLLVIYFSYFFGGKVLVRDELLLVVESWCFWLERGAIKISISVSSLISPSAPSCKSFRHPEDLLGFEDASLNFSCTK